MDPRIAIALSFVCVFGDPPAANDDPAPATNPKVVAEEAHRRALDASVERGLKYLAEHQLACGAWSGDVGHKQEDSYLVFESAKTQEANDRGHMGVTALAGLAILASGNVPGRGTYGKVLDRAIDYVVAHADEYGYLSDSDTRMYSHAFATLFLAEVEGMTKTKKAVVHETLRRASQFIADTQNEYGAWRYSPFTTEADLSVTVCQVQALRSARDVGAHVPIATIRRVLDYVRASRIEDGYETGGFYYKIYGTAARTKSSYAINAAAATSLLCAGVYDESQFGAAVKYLEDEYDGLSRNYPDHFYFWYGNYYATQALHQIGGRRFERFFDKISADLLRRQQEDGRWCNDVGPGDNFATAVACIILRVPDEYLPMLQR